MSTDKPKKQIVTATVTEGRIMYSPGARPGSRKMFYVDGRATIYVKGRLDPNTYERLTLDLMRKVAAIGLPVSELRRVTR